MNKLLIALFLLSSSFMALGSDDANNVAKAIILRGKVWEVRPGQKPNQIKKGEWVKEGSILRSENASFVKLLFIDKSQMNLGPNSEMQIKEFPKNQAGIINLFKGKVRSKVTKNYMDIDKSGSKLFIKTKTAAMGVRGTDFQVIFNPRNSVTSLVTFEGAVAMTRLDNVRANANIDRRALDAQLNSREAVMVKQGQYSGALPNQRRVSIPVKISPTQLESLKTDDPSVSTTSDKRKPASVVNTKKVVRSIVPKGLDAKKVAEANSGSLDKAIADGVGSQAAQVVVEKTQEKIEIARSEGPPPEGFIDTATGAFAPPAGGYVDEKTGLYVPPSEGSTFDPNAGVYIPPPEVGSVDSETGTYVPPEGYTLKDSGELVPIEGREIASIDGEDNTQTSGTKSDGGTINVLQTTTLDGTSEKETIGLTNETDKLTQDFLLESTIDQNNREIDAATSGRSKVEFRISR